MSDAKILDLSGNLINNDKPQQPEEKVNTHDTDVHCIHCDSIFFTQIFSMKKISGIQSPSGKPMNAPTTVIIICAQCGHQFIVDPITGDQIKHEDDDELSDDNSN